MENCLGTGGRGIRGWREGLFWELGKREPLLTTRQI